MSDVLSVYQLSKSFGPSTVLEGISFVLNIGDRAGLVGANGAGKSTLLRIVAGEMESDGGIVAIRRGIEIGYLPQQPPDPGTASIDDLVFESIGQLRALETRLRELELLLGGSSTDDGTVETTISEYGQAQERYERLGGYDLDYRIDIVFAGLSIAHLPRERSFNSLSGGEKARTLLAMLLLRSPDLLLLDEPTNHLDFASIAWLERYLADYRGTVLVVSHDRHLLNGSVNRILEIDEHTHSMKDYVGDYDAFQTAKALERARWESAWIEQQEEIRELKRALRVSARQVAHNRSPRDGDKTAYDFFGGRVQGAISRNVRNIEERLRRIELDSIPKPPEQLRISPDFNVDELRGDAVVRVDGLSKRFDGGPVLDDVTFVLGPRQRVVIVGPNGAGKSTLLNLIAGRIQPDCGSIALAAGVRLGYLDQDAGDPSSTSTVLEIFRDGLVGYEDEFVRDLFRYGLFTRDDLSKQIRQLSTGQRRKLQIARLIAEQANLLLLDEPTNHLSFEILEEFERALAGFDGPILAVSHDRWFIQRFEGSIWALRDGRLTTFPGSGDDLLAAMPAGDG